MQARNIYRSISLEVGIKMRYLREHLGIDKTWMTKYSEESNPGGG
jgi:hypothetical protein